MMTREINAIFLLASLSFSIVLAGCGTQSIQNFDSTRTVDCSVVSPERLIQRYVLSYDGEENKTFVEAAFLSGHPFGPYIRIKSTCSISDDAATLFERLTADPESGPFQATYIARSTGSGPHTFTLVDAAGNSIQNTVTLPTIDFVSSPSTISLASDKEEVEFSPVLDTSTWTTGEVYLEVVDSKTNPQARIRVRTRTSSSAGTAVKTISLKIKGGDFSRLFPSGQPVFVRLTKEVVSDVSTSSGGGGTIRTTYSTAFRSTDVTP